MARNSAKLPVAGTPETVVNLARKHLGMGSTMFYAPSIPSAKIDNARVAHAQHLPEDEEVLVLHDATVFGSADEGFLITETRLCWKNLWDHPRQIEWANLDARALSAEGSSVVLAGGKIELLTVVPPGIVALFQELATRARAPDLGPYRASERIVQAPTPVTLPERLLLSLTRTYVGEVSDVFYHPAIPASKEARARRAHADHLFADERIVVLYDDTVFGSAEEGFVLTPERLCWKNITEDAKELPWAELDPALIETSGTTVKVQGGDIQLSGRPELRGPVTALLRALGEEAKKRDAGGEG